MADENGNFPKIHIDFVANGDYVHLRTDSGAELAEVVGGFEENSEAIFKGIGNIKQQSLAVGVFTGNASQPSTSTGAASAPPKTTPAQTAPGATPHCPDHGEMKDMRGKRNKQGQPYRNRFYCKNFQCKTPGQGEWIE